jgi:hypothetical protein
MLLGLWYNQVMSANASTSMIEHLLPPADQSMPPEAARWIMSLRADAELQARYEELADKNTEGAITPDELRELEQFVVASELIGLMQLRARRVLANSNGHA